MSERVRVDVADGVADLVLASAERNNAIDRQWTEEFSRATVRCDQPDVRAVLVRAEGRCFTVGGDLKHMAAAGDLAHELDEMIEDFHAGLARLGELGAPVVCAVQGPAAGGGVGLLWCADEVLLAPDVRIVFGFHKLGLSGDGGSSWALPRLVGLRRAQQLLMGGRDLTADEAVEWGLATEVVPADELHDRARARARHYADGPTLAYAEQRRLLRAGWSEGLAAEHAAMVLTGASGDAGRGVEAFVARREPRFEGS